MSEIKTPLIELAEGQAHTADGDGAHVITADHAHADILRYVVSDIGKAEALAILEGLS